MSGSVNSGDLLGGDLGRWALGACVVVAIVLLAPIGLVSVAFGAILGAASGLSTHSAGGTTGQVAITRALPTASVQLLSTGAQPNQEVVTTAHGLTSGWAERGPLNQYALSNYRGDQSWATWRNADCSAAALDWLLNAYGQHLASLEDAIGLVGPGIGISPSRRGSSPVQMNRTMARSSCIASRRANWCSGPQQIEARISQEPAISSQITLWSQQGSQVLRGNLLVIPLEDAVLYVQPLYIQAQSSPLPELKRVIVASTDSVVMSDRLDLALTALGQGRSGGVLTAAASPQQPQQQPPANAPPGATGSAADLAGAARHHLRAAEAAAGKGDWTTYGTEMATVHQLLDQLAAAAGH